MKISMTICFLVFLLIANAGSSQSVAINNDGSTSHSSAMLEIKSTGKGLLIPRMATSERTSIASPAIGLLVYDTETVSFWYRGSTGWIEMSNSATSLWEKESASYIYNRDFLPVHIGNTGFLTEGILNVAKSDASATGLINILSLQRYTDGTATNGIGGSIVFRNQVSNGGIAVSGRISSLLEDAAVASFKGALQFQTYSSGLVSNSMNLNSTGLSVGSTAPAVSKLDIFTDGFFLGGMRLNGTGAGVGPTVYFNAANKDWTITASNNDFSVGPDKFVIRDYSSAQNRLLIDDVGNVGIGTDFPGAANKLDVSGDINVSGKIKSTATGTARLIPICYGNISSAGTSNILGSTANFTVSRISTGFYTITITGENYQVQNYVTTVTPSGISARIAATNSSTGSLQVRIFDAAGVLVDENFHFVVYKP